MITSIYKLPFKKHVDPKRKSDLIIGYEMSDNRKQPVNVVYLTKEKIPNGMNEEQIDDFEMKSGVIKSSENLKFESVPIVKMNELNNVSYMVAGTSGSGKSFYVAHLVNNIKRLDRFKEADIFLITSPTSKPDKAYEDHIDKYMKINLDSDEFYTLTSADFENAIVIFDDVNSLQNRHLEQFIFNLQKSLAENARKNNVALIHINHASRDFNRTKAIIHESAYYTLFPSANFNDTKKFLKSYMDWDEDQIKQIKRLSRHTRSVTIHKSNCNDRQTIKV